MYVGLQVGPMSLLTRSIACRCRTCNTHVSKSWARTLFVQASDSVVLLGCINSHEWLLKAHIGCAFRKGCPKPQNVCTCPAGVERHIELKVLKTRVITDASQLTTDVPCPHTIRMPSTTEEDITKHRPTAMQQPSTESDNPPRNQVSLSGLETSFDRNRVVLIHGHMIVPCADNTFLELLELRHTRSDQQGSRRMSDGSVGLSGKDFMTGLGRRYALYLHRPASHV